MEQSRIDQVVAAAGRVGEFESTRRQFLIAGASASVALAVPLATELIRAETAKAIAMPGDATLGAFADTLIPGRKVWRTDLGNWIDPRSIAGVDSLPGAVEADAVALYHHPKIGFELLSPVFLADLEARSLARGGTFLSLNFKRRTEVCVAGLAYNNPTRLIWEAAAAVPFAAFCGGLAPAQSSSRAAGYRVMGHPGATASGYTDASYNRVLATELTSNGSLS